MSARSPSAMSPRILPKVFVMGEESMTFYFYPTDAQNSIQQIVLDNGGSMAESPVQSHIVVLDTQSPSYLANLHEYSHVISPRILSGQPRLPIVDHRFFDEVLVNLNSQRPWPPTVEHLRQRKLAADAAFASSLLLRSMEEANYPHSGPEGDGAEDVEEEDQIDMEPTEHSQKPSPAEEGTSKANSGPRARARRTIGDETINLVVSHLATTTLPWKGLRVAQELVDKDPSHTVWSYQSFIVKNLSGKGLKLEDMIARYAAANGLPAPRPIVLARRKSTGPSESVKAAKKARLEASKQRRRRPPTEYKRQPFTDEDDELITQALAERSDLRVTSSLLYQLSQLNPRHTPASYQSYLRDNLTDKKKLADRVLRAKQERASTSTSTSISDPGSSRGSTSAAGTAEAQAATAEAPSTANRTTPSYAIRSLTKAPASPRKAAKRKHEENI